MAAAQAIGWVCPEDGRELEAASKGLRCRACGRAYLVVDGIPDFVGERELAPVQRFERGFRDQWVRFDGDRRVQYERRIEQEAVLGRLQPQPGEAVLDGGCGRGGMTRACLDRGAQVVALDFSLARLRGLRDAGPGLTVAAADVARLPLPAAKFEAALCTQVLEHLPEPDQRRGLIAGLHRALRPGGRLVMTVYNYSRTWRARGQAREGRHETGIFYHCYTATELEGEINATGFEIVELCGLIHLLPRTYRVWPRLGPLGRAADHGCERPIPFSRDWGHLLLVHARKA